MIVLIRRCPLSEQKKLPSRSIQRFARAVQQAWKKTEDARRKQLQGTLDDLLSQLSRGGLENIVCFNGIRGGSDHPDHNDVGDILTRLANQGGSRKVASCFVHEDDDTDPWTVRLHGHLLTGGEGRKLMWFTAAMAIRWSQALSAWFVTGYVEDESVPERDRLSNAFDGMIARVPTLDELDDSPCDSYRFLLRFEY